MADKKSLLNFVSDAFTPTYNLEEVQADNAAKAAATPSLSNNSIIRYEPGTFKVLYATEQSNREWNKYIASCKKLYPNADELLIRQTIIQYATSPYIENSDTSVKAWMTATDTANNNTTTLTTAVLHTYNTAYAAVQTNLDKKVRAATTTPQTGTVATNTNTAPGTTTKISQPVVTQTVATKVIAKPDLVKEQADKEAQQQKEDWKAVSDNAAIPKEYLRDTIDDLKSCVKDGIKSVGDVKNATFKAIGDNVITNAIKDSADSLFDFTEDVLGLNSEGESFINSLIGQIAGLLKANCSACPVQAGCHIAKRANELVGKLFGGSSALGGIWNLADKLTTESLGILSSYGKCSKNILGIDIPNTIVNIIKRALIVKDYIGIALALQSGADVSSARPYASTLTSGIKSMLIDVTKTDNVDGYNNIVQLSSQLGINLIEVLGITAVNFVATTCDIILSPTIQNTKGALIKLTTAHDYQGISGYYVQTDLESTGAERVWQRTPLTSDELTYKIYSDGIYWRIVDADMTQVPIKSEQTITQAPNPWEASYIDYAFKDTILMQLEYTESSDSQSISASASSSESGSKFKYLKIDTDTLDEFYESNAIRKLLLKAGLDSDIKTISKAI